MTSQPLCRLCIEEVEPLLDIFGEFGREQNIQELLFEHFSLEIKEDDLLSDKMCTICWSKLTDFHSFYAQIQKAQDRITLVVLKEDKAEDVDELNELIEHKIIITTDAYGEETVLEDFTDESDGNIAESHTENVSTHIKPEFRNARSSTKPLETSDETIVQIQMIPDPKPNLSITMQLNELSDAEDMQLDDESTHVVEFDEEITSTAESIENITDNLADDDSDFHKRSLGYTSRKRLKKIKTRKEIILADGEQNYENDLTRRKRTTRKLKQRGLKVNINEQKQKEIEIIETFYKLQCDLCNERYEQTQPLFDHYFEMHKIRGYILCCGKKFYRKSLIAEHVTWHTNPENFTCPECCVLSENKRSHENHMLQHAAPDTELYQCEHCSKRFTQKFKLDKHKLSHLKDDEKEYICEDCDKPYASEALLRAHKRVVHEQTYAHMCEICAKVFKSRAFFEKHQLEHTGKNLPKVQCNICQAWMKNEHTMRAHMRNHQDEGQEHECDICGKKGPSRNAIAKHKRFVHLSVRKFKCTFCEKAFKRAITLKEHMTVHTGDVLYSCTFCPKTFNSGANMHAHRKKAHPTEWYEEKQSKLDSMKESV